MEFLEVHPVVGNVAGNASVYLNPAVIFSLERRMSSKGDLEYGSTINFINGAPALAVYETVVILNNDLKNLSR